MGSESTTQEMFSAGYECTCHIAPPCSFCCAMDEDEVEAWVDDGYDGLERLWDERDRKRGNYCGFPDPAKGPDDAD